MLNNEPHTFVWGLFIYKKDMKNYFFAAFVACMALTSCTSSQEKAIESAAQGYLDAMGNYQIDDAFPYATKITRETTLGFYTRLMENADTAYINSNRPAIITINKTKIISDTTARVYYHKHTPIKDVDDSIMVRLEDGQWLVDVRLANTPFFFPDPNAATKSLQKLNPKKSKTK